MEKHIVIALLALTPLLLISFGSVYAHDSTTVINNYNNCLGHLDEARQYVNADWDKSQIHSYCVTLLDTGELTIHRETQRDIVIFMVNIGDQVKLPLDLLLPTNDYDNHVTVPLSE